MLGDGVERRGLHVEAVGLLPQILQELGGLDVRGDEAVGGEELAVGGFRRLHGQSVEEHRVVDEGGAAGDDLRDADQRLQRCRVSPGRADVHNGEIFVLMLLQELQHGVRGVLTADAAKVHTVTDVHHLLFYSGEKGYLHIVEIWRKNT